MKDMLETFIEDHLNERWNIAYECSASNPHYHCSRDFIKTFYVGNKSDVEVDVKDFFHLHRKEYLRAYVNVGLYEIEEDENPYVFDHLSAYKKEAVHQFLLFSEGKLLEGYERQDPILSKNTWTLLTQDKNDKEFLDSVYAKGNELLEAHKAGTFKLKVKIDKLDMSDINDLYEYTSRIYQLDTSIFKRIAWKFLLQLHTESLGTITHFITTDFTVGCCPFNKMHIVNYAGLEIAKSFIGERRIFFTLTIKQDAKVHMKICDIQEIENKLLSCPLNIRGKVNIVKVNRKRKSH